MHVKKKKRNYMILPTNSTSNIFAVLENVYGNNLPFFYTLAKKKLTEEFLQDF